MQGNKTYIRSTNNIVYVEPNYTYSTDGYDAGGLETFEFIPNTEDYSIFVNLEIETVGRTIQTGNKVYRFSYINKGGEESTNLMSGSKINATDGSVINTLTTNYTNYHIKDLKSVGASPELFGINYIDIAYNNFMVPEVTIEFVDVRGASVFGQKEAFETNNVERAIRGNYVDDITNTFFQCFFTFPYPKFTLVVKGFYGKPVSYELTCADFRARFNSESGDFSCTAKFVGYQFSFLNDVMLNALIAAPYSDFLGAEYWNQQNFKFKDYSNGGEKDMITIAELLKKVKYAETSAEQISQNSPEVQEKNNIEQITERLSRIKRLYEEYVGSIRDLVKTKNTSDGIDLYISDIADNNISKAAVIIVADTTDNFEQHFDEKGNQAVTKAFNALSGELDSFTSEYTTVTFPTLTNFAGATVKKRIFEHPTDTSKCIIDLNGVNDDIKKRSYSLYKNFEAKVLNQNKINQKNKYLDTVFVYFYDDNGFTDALDSEMKKASDREKELAEKISTDKMNALTERLGFKPSVENVTRLLMAHFETFAHMVFQTGRMIDAEDPKRDTKKVGITDDDDVADVPEIYRSSETGALLVPPFPKVTKIVEKQGVKNREESWVGDYGNVFKEVDLVHGLLNGIEEFVKIAKSGGNTGSAGSTSTAGAVMSHPLSPIDFILTNNVYGDFSQTEVSDLLGLVGLRALQILGATNFSDWNENCEVLGKAEAENLLASEKLNGSLKKLLKPIADDVDSVISVLNGNPAGNIQKPSNGVWPWQESTQSVGIISNDQFNICKIDGVDGGTMYCLPIQNLNWNKIKREIIHSKSAAASNDYFNISKRPFRNSYKDNIFNIETNISRIKDICEKQLQTPDGIDFYRNKILKEAEYNSSDYKKYLKNEKKLLAYPIEGADKLLPANKSCMIPCTTNYIKQMSWGGGYNMNCFNSYVPGDCFLDGTLWYDKNNNLVKRKGENGVEDFLKDLDTNKYTLTEIPGLESDLKPTTDTSLFTEKLYYLQDNDMVKGFLLLCSLGYLYDYESIIQNEICRKDKTISIIPLPAVIFAGGVLWAKENLRKFKECTPSSTTIKNCFDYLSYLDEQIKIKLKKTFEKWINSGIQNNNIIVSFKAIKSNMEIKLLKSGRTYESFFNALGEPQDKTWIGTSETWFNSGVFKGNNYANLLEFFAGEFRENFFRNYICIHEDLKGRGSTIGMRVGNRDGSLGIKQYVDFALAPCLFTKNSKFFFSNVENVLSVSEGNLKSFFKGFLERIKEDTPEDEGDKSVSQAKETETTTDIKVGIYRYCKLIYDKWFGGISDSDFEKFRMKEFFESNTKCFHFIDAFYNYANQISINIGDFCDKIVNSYESADYSLLSFLSSVYSENKFNLLCVQNFLDISKKENMERMFDLVPYTEIDWVNIQNHPNFIVNYAYEASSHLDIKDDEYENDGFLINQAESISNKWPEALKSRNQGKTSGLNVPAFGVSYGKMYQSYFKDVSVSMDNPTVTEQSIKAQFAIACQNNEQKKQDGESKEYTYGQDLYSIYSNNSYTCEVTMMGCAWVQPLMLFVLNNVPMFRGTYQIINVTHHIEQGEMVTKFKGVRMANVITRLVEENSVGAKSTQTDAGVNTEINQEGAYACTDNTCSYSEYPIAKNGDVNVALGSDDNYNASQIMSKIMARGYTKEQAAGIVGNMAVESPGFKANINVCDSNKKWAGGLCMWNDDSLYWLLNNRPDMIGQPMPAGESMSCPTKWEKKVNNDMPSADEQVTFLLDSLEQSEYLTQERHHRCVKKHLLETNTPEQAAFNFARYFEACSDCKIENSKTVKKRQDNARKYYDNFSDTRVVPPIVNNGDDRVSELSNGFLHALNQTSKSSAVGVEIGIDKDKSNGDTIYLTNANKSQNFGKVLDMMLQTYWKTISEIRWIVPGDNGNQSLPPAGYIVTLTAGTTYTVVKVVNESNGEVIQEISVEDEGGINPDFKKAIVKKYKDATNRDQLVKKYVMPLLSDEQIEKLFGNSEIKDCGSVIQDGTNTSSYTPIEGPITTSNWDVNAFVRNLHYWQSHTCEQKGKTRGSYGGCGVCTGVINRALESTGFGRKYWATYPWEVCNKMNAADSEFKQIVTGITSSKNEIQINEYNPLAGDICTMWWYQHKDGSSLPYHTCAFDGRNWISDFVQNHCNVYMGRKTPISLEFHIFRHK